MAQALTASALARTDHAHLWHPFTQQTEWQARDPIIITRARGVWLYDQHGRRLLDGNASLWVNVWGHGEPALNAALRKQLARLAHSTFLGLSHAPAIELARALVDLAPRGLSRVFYSDNGSTAVEVALKMAYQYMQLTGQARKTRFVSLQNGYHGDTLGAVSVGGVPLFHARFRDLLFKGWSVPAGDLAAAERVLRQHHAALAGFIVEPLVQGASGMLLMPKGYLKEVERLCRRYGVLLIADEVATGFGRTGKMFAVEHEGVRPDFLCVAKSLTGGYLPLAATLAREKIYRAFLGRFDAFKAFFHGHTYTANPLACAVALENLRLYKTRHLLKNVNARARQLAEGLRPLAAHPHVKAIRQIGLMCGIELVEDKARGTPYPPARRMGLNVCDEAIRRGLWLRPLGDVLVLMPPLAITEKEMSQFISLLQEAIQVTSSKPRPR